MASKKHLNKVLSELTQLLRSTKAFVLDQAPQVLKEIILLNRVRSILDALAGLVLIAGAIVILNVANNLPAVGCSDYDLIKCVSGKAILLYLVFAGGVVFATLVLYGAIVDILKVFLAPKTFLIEYIKNLID